MAQEANHTKLNDQEIAQLLAGSLDEDARTALLARLAADPDAREVLAMALEALQVAEEFKAVRSQASGRSDKAA